MQTVNHTLLPKRGFPREAHHPPAAELQKASQDPRAARAAASCDWSAGSWWWYTLCHVTWRIKTQHRNLTAPGMWMTLSVHSDVFQALQQFRNAKSAGLPTDWKSPPPHRRPQSHRVLFRIHPGQNFAFKWREGWQLLENLKNLRYVVSYRSKQVLNLPVSTAPISVLFRTLISAISRAECAFCAVVSVRAEHP